MAIHLLQVPYDSGHRAQRMGRGPLHLVEWGAARDRLRRVEPDDVRFVSVEMEAAFPTEVGTAFELHCGVSGAVAEAMRDGALPLVLAGNCNSAAQRAPTPACCTEPGSERRNPIPF